MKFSPSIIALVVALLSQTAAALTAAEECGDLGVMKIPDVLPEGVTAADVRKCAGHPGTGIRSRDDASLIARGAQACETKAQFGCSEDGFCWKVCGTGGEWCWTASSGGSGPWHTCNTFKDCGITSDFACGVGCAPGKEDQCGCSC